MAGTTTGTTGRIAGSIPEQSAGSEAQRLQVRLLVLQPTPFCNINCAYCYLPARDDTRRMTRDTLARTAAVVLGSPFLGDRLTIVWHAGEPLVLPPSYYRDAFAIFAAATRPGLELTQSFQTNGTLINQEWAEFFIETEAHVGISIDGPAGFHDRYRHSRKGRGTHAATLAGIRELQQRAIEFHVITVLTDEALNDPDAFVDFYLDCGIREVGFNIEEIEGPHTRSSLQSIGTTARYARFMERVIERVTALPPGTLEIRELRDTFSLIASPHSETRHNEQVEPLTIVSIDVDGNISTFSPELLGNKNAAYGDFIFGNIHQHSLADVLSHPMLMRTRSEIQKGVRLCADTCAYFAFCKGGAPANKLFENGRFESTETLYCQLTKQTLFNVVLNHFEATLALEASSP